MSERPTFIDLGRPPPLSESNSARSSPLDRPSPRLYHLAGDVPPPMSPLDAFAAQSRLLAKQLDDSRRNGRRASRLPPLAVANTLGKPRPGYIRAQSGESDMNKEEAVSATEDDKPGLRMEVEEPLFRPQSFYPRMSNTEDATQINSQFGPPSGTSQTFSTPLEQPIVNKSDYFGAVMASTPEPIVSGKKSFEVKSPSVRTHGSSVSSHHQTDPERGLSIESQSSREDYPHALLPPKPAFARQTSSIRSVSIESSDDESMGPPRDYLNQPRKFSSASVVSLPYAPQSPFASHPRPPSITSEYSVGGSRLGRPSFNFSRPLSHSSRPSMEFPRGKESLDSPTSVAFGDGLDTPRSMDVAALDHPGSEAPVTPSYIYAKYSLPRGRMLNRGSTGLETIPMPVFEWEQPQVQANVITATPPAVSYENPLPPHPTPPRSVQSDDQASTSTHGDGRTSSDSPHSTAPSETPLSLPSSPHSPKGKHKQSSPSVNSGSTIKASSSRTIIPNTSNTPSHDLSAEEHLQKGIACHEAGSLKESTYHLRLAARRNNPTAMMLYALACRHGWGMRSNPADAYQWLRKAMDCASIELAEDTQTDANPEQKLAKKSRKAQFALSVYEMGVSHMNGWGIGQDKSLALRCFEIAGDWGDADAMAEAGFCYAKGVGCKKDLKKAARWYRRAEEGGISMVGNSWYVFGHYSTDFFCLEQNGRARSWREQHTNALFRRIYKSKYAEDRNSEERSSRKDKAQGTPEKERKSRNISRSRGIFSRKRSVAGT